MYLDIFLIFMYDCNCNLLGTGLTWSNLIWSNSGKMSCVTANKTERILK